MSGTNLDATAKNHLLIPVEETLVSDYPETPICRETEVSSTVYGIRYMGYKYIFAVESAL